MKISDTQAIPQQTRETTSGPLVSVIMGTYNRPKLLKKAVQSVVDQKYEHWELVITNDGGEDVSGVIDSFNDDRIKYYSMPENFGAAHSYNHGLYMSSGEYIAYLADDDIYYPNHLEVLVKALTDNPGVEGVYSDQYRVDCDLVDGEYTRIHGKTVDFSLDFDKITMLALRNIIPQPCCMHTRGVLKKAGVFDESLKVLIDYDFFRRASFFMDFVHIPVLTGEYFTPVNNQNRITDLNISNPERYNEILTEIKLKKPPGTWDRVQSLTLLIYTSEFNQTTYEQLAFIFSRIFYPKSVYLLIDGYKQGDKETIAGLGKLPLKLIFNVSNEGLEPSLDKFFSSWFCRSWFQLVTESSLLTDAYRDELYTMMKEAMSGRYSQPGNLQSDRLFTDVLNVN